MVSFSCENCGDILTKKKLDQHRGRCRGASFTCIDCMVHFQGFDYRAHTTCMTEAQKYQGHLYRPEKEKGKGPKGKPQQNQSKTNGTNGTNNSVAIVDAPPKAPSPPAAAAVNVFDFLVTDEPSPTKDASKAILPSNGDADYQRNGYSYGTGPIPSSAPAQGPSAFQTPAKGSKSETKDKSDKKRKRTAEHDGVNNTTNTTDGMAVDTPVLHSGLTGGLNRMVMAGEYPDTPEYDSPLKRAKSSRQPSQHTSSTTTTTTNGPAGTSRRTVSSTSAASKREHRHRSSDGASKGAQAESDRQVVPHRSRAEHFLSFVTKGPESEKGYSINKALKRYHRERGDRGSASDKADEEKELWKSLRLKKNERGEIVLIF